MIEDFEVEMSPLCQSITSAGKTVNVDIYADGEGKWILEVQDQVGNSTVWGEHFLTDSGALTEAKNAIQEDGIDSLIGPESGKSDGKWQ